MGIMASLSPYDGMRLPLRCPALVFSELSSLTCMPYLIASIVTTVLLFTHIADNWYRLIRYIFTSALTPSITYIPRPLSSTTATPAMLSSREPTVPAMLSSREPTVPEISIKHDDER